MERITQTVKDILANLTSLPTDWRDKTADAVIAYIDALPENRDYSRADLQALLDLDFELAMTVFRLFLEKSKDELNVEMKAALGESGGIGRKAYERDRERYLDTLDSLLLRQAMAATVNAGYTWRDILVERLKGGRGSAIKGQARGRALEDFTDSILAEVFGQGNYDKRCNFVGRSGQKKEKADFAIPNKEDPRLLIEVKAYGATGSKQTDVLGDVSRIIEEKRPDVAFLLVTDGATWRARTSDLKKLVAYQNQGYIYRIYTKMMGAELRADLEGFKEEQGL